MSVTITQDDRTSDTVTTADGEESIEAAINGYTASHSDSEASIV